MIETKKLTIGLIAIFCIACLIGTATASIVATYNQSTSWKNEKFIYPTKAPIILPVKEKITPSSYLLNKAKNNTAYAAVIAVNKKPYYYSKAQIDPAPYIQATLPDGLQYIKIVGNYWWVDWDADRLPFDMVVIRDSQGQANVTVEEIDAACYESLYVKRYNSGNKEPFVKGLTPHSGHMRNGKETFLAYHFYIYPDGRIVKGIELDESGWFANNWDINRRSIGILLMGDYADTNNPPPAAQIRAMEKVIKSLKLFNPNLRVVPYYAIWSQSNSPGFAWFQQWLKQNN